MLDSSQTTEHTDQTEEAARVSLAARARAVWPLPVSHRGDSGAHHSRRGSGPYYAVPAARDYRQGASQCRYGSARRSLDRREGGEMAKPVIWSVLDAIPAKEFADGSAIIHSCRDAVSTPASPDGPLPSFAAILSRVSEQPRTRLPYQYGSIGI